MAIHDLDLDGVRSRQNAADGFDPAYYIGIEASDQSNSDNGPIQVYNAEIHDFVRMGIHIRQSRNSTVASTVHLHDIGCFSASGCPLLGRPLGDPEASGAVPSVKTVGWGAMCEGPGANGCDVQGTCENVTKICYEAFSAGAVDRATSVTGWSIHNITCNSALTSCAIANGGAFGTFDNVTAIGTPGHQSHLIGCTGYCAGVSITNSTATGGGYRGIWISGYTNGGSITVRGNKTSGSCLQGNGAEMEITGNSGGAGGGSLTFENNVIGGPGATCTYGLLIQGFSNASLTGGSVENRNSGAVLFPGSLKSFTLDNMTLTYSGNGIQATGVSGTIGNHNVFSGPDRAQLVNTGSTLTDRRGLPDAPPAKPQ
jgi:hypothetical protein